MKSIHHKDHEDHQDSGAKSVAAGMRRRLGDLSVVGGEILSGRGAEKRKRNPPAARHPVPRQTPSVELRYACTTYA
jgi:hypothetical protein